MLIEVGWKKMSRLVSSSRGCAKVPQLKMKAQLCNQYQGDKVHKTLRRLLFVTGAARDEQMGEQLLRLGSSCPTFRLNWG